MTRLQKEKPLRTKTPIDWKDGQQVRDLSRKLKETRVTKAFDEHFFKHPVTAWGATDSAKTQEIVGELVRA